MSDYQNLIRRLREWTTDWNGAKMVPGEPPRDGIHCDVINEAADALEALVKERDELKRTMTAFQQAHYENGLRDGEKRGKRQGLEEAALEAHEAAMVWPDADHAADASQAIEDTLRAFSKYLTSLITTGEQSDAKDEA